MKIKSKTRKHLFIAIAMLIFWNSDLQAQEKKELFTKDNLTTMSQHLDNTEGEEFKLFLKYPEKVNAVLGKDKAQYMLRTAISKAYFQGITPTQKPNFDWSDLKNMMKSKFGEIGLETLYSKQMMYYLDAKDWSNFGKYYVLYFEKALKRPEYDINNLNWVLFENVNDPKVLKFACDVVMEYAMEEWYQNNWQSYDTYANLLYKTGQKEKAIEWETKAVKLSNNDKGIVETLEKMKTNQRTWPETAARP
nr:hypothetical protein [Pedobacter sp. ASV19]